MGYRHYWRRLATIPQDTMRAIVDDFARLILPLDDAGVRLCRGKGEDAAQVTPDGVFFNGPSSRAACVLPFDVVPNPVAFCANGGGGSIWLLLRPTCLRGPAKRAAGDYKTGIPISHRYSNVGS
jgi:hypothetical protein